MEDILFLFIEIVGPAAHVVVPAQFLSVVDINLHVFSRDELTAAGTRHCWEADK